MRLRTIVALISAVSAATIVLFAACSGTGANTNTILSLEAPAAAKAGAFLAPAAAPASSPAVSTSVRTTDRPHSPWVRDRIAAVEQIWNIAPAGQAWLDTYDLRQMQGKPAWFGSNGYDSWAGVGQAVPRIAIHELSHSYWGAFPVAGRPDLTGRRAADGVPDVSKAFRADLETFLGQPPDRFEPLRDRFRHMPDLNSGDYPELYHSGEADLVYMTGGNISLVPPILRKYVSGFFGDRGVGGDDFTDWAGALRWWYGLSPEDKAVAGQVFGFGHFPLERYAALADGSHAVLEPHIARILAREEEQRLIDFADQYLTLDVAHGSFTDATGVDRGLGFWRRYLIETRDLHGRHPDVLRQHSSLAGRELAAAFDFYLEMKALPEAVQAQRYKAEHSRPLLSDLVFMLKPKAVSALMTDPGFGADRSQLVLASRVAAEEVPPGEVRAPEPQRVLKGAGVVENADVATLTAGVQRLTSHSSGNFMIDQPVDSAIYDVLDLLSQSDPRGVMQVFENSRLRLQPWIETHPARAAATLRADVASAAMLIERTRDMRSTDSSLIHSLIAADPRVAADILIELDRRAIRSGHRDALTIVPRTLNSLAYDAYWSSLRSGPRADLSADAAFFSRLVQVKGAAWVESNALSGMATYRRAIASGDNEAEFGSRHAETLSSLSFRLPASDPAASLLARLAGTARGD